MERRWSWPAIGMLALLALAILMGASAYAPERGFNARAASDLDRFCNLYLKIVVPRDKVEFEALSYCKARGLQ